MQLIGYMDSPFVRRVAVSMHFLALPFEHREISIFRDYEAFRVIYPGVKVPLLRCDDGEVLVDSGLILDYLQGLAGRSLMPATADAQRLALQYLGHALVAMEKVAQVIYETSQRPPEKRHEPWLQRVRQQLDGVTGLMEQAVRDRTSQWLLGDQMCQADISTAVVWRFMKHIDAVAPADADFPALAAFSATAEALPEFKACPLSG